MTPGGMTDRHRGDTFHKQTQQVRQRGGYSVRYQERPRAPVALDGPHASLVEAQTAADQLRRRCYRVTVFPA